MESYDENLQENMFFQALMKWSSNLHGDETFSKCLICVPRIGSFDKSDFTEEDLSSHVLVPLDEDLSTFKSLFGKVLKIDSDIISYTCNETSVRHSVKILFEEDFYDNDTGFRALCINQPLNVLAEGKLSEGNCIRQLHSVADCIAFLRKEIVDLRILHQLDLCAEKCNAASQFSIENDSLQKQQEVARMLYTQGLQTAMKNFIANKTVLDRHTKNCIATSIETYLLHAMHDNIIIGLSALYGDDDAELNKALRNLTEIQIHYLKIRSQFYDIIPKARSEISQITLETTPLGKLNRLRRTVHIINEVQDSVVATDDLLPVVIFLIVKSSISNWLAQLAYVRHFRFSRESLKEPDEHEFILTSFEAAVHHIKSGALNVAEVAKSASRSIDFLELVAAGRDVEVDIILKSAQDKVEDDALQAVKRCHPLCSCDKCEHSHKWDLQCRKFPLNITNNKGWFALHVSSLHGHLIVTDLLLKAGARVDDRDFSGSAPLHLACKRGHHSTVLLLLDRAADVNALDDERNSPLHLASANGHEQCVKTLLFFDESHRNNLDINSVNGNGDTALHNAARWGFVPIVKMLLQYGAKVDIRNKHKLTPVQCSHNGVARLHMEQHSKQSFTSKRSEWTSDQHVPMHTEDGARVSDPNLSLCRDKVSPEKQAKFLRAIRVGDLNLASFYLGIENNSSANNLDSDCIRKLCHPLCQCDKCQALIELEKTFSHE